MQFKIIMYVFFFFFLSLLLRIGFINQCSNRSSLKLGDIQKTNLETCLPLLHMHKNSSLSLAKISLFLRQELQIPLLPFTLRRTLLPKQSHLVQNKQQDI